MKIVLRILGVVVGLMGIATGVYLVSVHYQGRTWDLFVSLCIVLTGLIFFVYGVTGRTTVRSMLRRQ